MTSLIKSRKGFTLIELLVVVAMIAMVAGAVSAGFSSAQERARIQKATSEVKAISQAIMAYENYAALKGESLPEVTDAIANESSIGFLIGIGDTYAQGQKVPALLMAAMTSGGAMMDPWGAPYMIKIKPGSENVQLKSISSTLKTGYFFPNLYRLSQEERQ